MLQRRPERRGRPAAVRRLGYRGLHVDRSNYEVTIRSGSGQLGGASCRLDDPYNIPIVTVPGHPELVAIWRSSPTPVRPSAPVVAVSLVSTRGPARSAFSGPQINAR